jgi:sugar lactone lactonase YvrE
MKSIRHNSLGRRAARAAACLALCASGVACKQTDASVERSAPAANLAAAPVALIQPTLPASPASTGAASLSGSVRILSADAAVLQRPTTAAFRGNDVWVAIGQLSALFSDGGKPQLPFQALSVALADGAAGTSPITLPGSDFYPEGITAASDGTLYVGSIMQGVIMKVPAGSLRAEPFVEKGVAKRGVLGMTVDADRQMLWFCDSNPKLEEVKKAGELVGVRLTDAKELVRHALSREADKAPFCNDVIVSPDGALWITDSAVGRVFHVPAKAALEPNSAVVWLSGGEVGPPPTGGSGANGLEWMDGVLIVANVGRGQLVHVNPQSDPQGAAPATEARAIELRLEGSDKPLTLCSPDGLARVPGSKNKLVVVENGGCAEKAPRIIEVTLKG